MKHNVIITNAHLFTTKSLVRPLSLVLLSQCWNVRNHLGSLRCKSPRPTLSKLQRFLIVQSPPKSPFASHSPHDYSHSPLEVHAHPVQRHRARKKKFCISYSYYFGIHLKCACSKFTNCLNIRSVEKLFSLYVGKQKLL